MPDTMDLDAPRQDDSHASSPTPTSSSGEEEEEDEPIDSLIQGRSKRSTAGRHMSALLDAEGDDDLALLFEEVDDDNEFSGEEDADEDIRMDESSDDDEDQGPDAKGDEDEGEKELQKEARAERKKRKTQDDLRLKALRKKVKIDPTAVSAVPGPPPRPKKKSERISWLPTQDEGPTRSSSRRQTMQNKEMTHARLKDSEEKRVRLIETMEKAAKRKAQFKPKERTQAEWLAEAERMERLNSKSLNRWEETEKRKADERRMKIEALQNRRLEGPVMSYWSGIATWMDGRLTRVGKVDIKSRPKIDKEEAARRKSKKEQEKEVAFKTLHAPPTLATPGPSEVTKNGMPPDRNQVTPASSQQAGMPPENGAAVPTPSEKGPVATEIPVPANAEPETAVPDAQSAETEAGKQETEKPTVTVVENQTPKAPVQAEPNSESKEQGEQRVTEKPTELAADGTREAIPGSDSTPQVPFTESTTPAPVSMPPPTRPVPEIPPTQVTGDSTQLATEIPQIPPEQPVTEYSTPTQPPPEIPVQPTIPDPTQPPPVVERTGRNVTILEDFDDHTAHSKEFSIYFNAKKPPRLSSTSSPSRLELLISC